LNKCRWVNTILLASPDRTSSTKIGVIITVLNDMAYPEFKYHHLVQHK
jgi:hypothetical protein